jgi:hypothetical protein
LGGAEELLMELRGRRPTTRRGLWEFVRCYYGLHLPRKRFCPGHVAPAEYVAASFFQTYGDLVIWANRGGGKTELGSVTTHLDSLFRPGCQTRILGGSLQQSERMYEYLGAKWHPLFADYLAGEPHSRCTQLRNGSAVEILSQSERSVRGQRVQRVKCDEVDEFDPDVWRAVQFVTRSADGTRATIEAFSTMHHPYGLMSEVVGKAGRQATDGDGERRGLGGWGIGEGNPGERQQPGDHQGRPYDGEGGATLMAWCLWETIERCTGDRSCSRCVLSDDCQGRAKEAEGFLRIDDAVAQMRRSGREAWESEMLCLKPQTQNQVFPRFSAAAHVAALDYDGAWPAYRSLDFGFVNPFVCLWAQLIGDDPDSARLVVLDEYVQSQRTVAEHAHVLASRHAWPIRTTFCDPAGRQRGDVTGSGACDELARHGILTRSSASGIMEGVDLVRALLAPALGRPRLVIDGRCRHLIRAMESYHYPDGRRSPDAAESPEKDGRHDHLIDALRYLAVGLLGRRGTPLRGRRYW